MKVTKPTKPSRTNTPAHRCEWGYRNPKNHLSISRFAKLIAAMLKSEDSQHITCPGCGRSIYVSIKIEPHNLPGAKAPQRERIHWGDE